jgi:ferredoxin
MKVWIDQELCTGDAQCVEICPEVFSMHEDDLTIRSYVRAADPSGTADVPRALEASVLEAAEYCPGACIFVDAAGSEGLIQ